MGIMSIDNAQRVKILLQKYNLPVSYSIKDADSFYETFLGEYPNSVAFEDLRGNYKIWTKAGRGSERKT